MVDDLYGTSDYGTTQPAAGGSTGKPPLRELRGAHDAGREPVWVIDDDRAIRWVLDRALARAGIGCRTFERGQDALNALEAAKTVGGELPLVLVSDIRMPGLSGVDLLTKVKELVPELPVIIMTAFSDLESAVSAFQGGAFEYLTKPFDVLKAVELISRAMEDARRRGLHAAAGQAGAAAQGAASAASPMEEPSAPVPDLIGQAPAMQEVFRAIGRLSQSNVTVLLTGESGAGKEVVARAIWKHSRRSRAPYIAINMAAIPRELLESELFGHEKGAFTGAVATRLGRFEQAKGGTLFLDEIGDMPMELQTRLLRVLSNGYFYRVGGHQPIKADVRVIAATNQNLEERVKSGQFREDLYHRLNVIRLRLPPLRDRVEDIAPLSAHFLAAGARELGVEPKTLTPEALNVIRARSPGMFVSSKTFAGGFLSWRRLRKSVWKTFPMKFVIRKPRQPHIRRRLMRSIRTEPLAIRQKRASRQKRRKRLPHSRILRRFVANPMQRPPHRRMRRVTGRRFWLPKPSGFWKRASRRFGKR